MFTSPEERAAQAITEAIRAAQRSQTHLPEVAGGREAAGPGKGRAVDTDLVRARLNQIDRLVAALFDIATAHDVAPPAARIRYDLGGRAGAALGRWLDEDLAVRLGDVIAVGMLNGVERRIVAAALGDCARGAVAMSGSAAVFYGLAADPLAAFEAVAPTASSTGSPRT